MASIFKQPGSKYWHGRVQRNGKPRRKSLKTTSRATAEKRLKEWVEELDALGWGDQPAKTYDEAMLHFLENHGATLRPASQRRYMVSAKALTPYFSGVYLHQITSGRMATFESGRRRDGVSAPTIRRDLACLSSMIESVVVDWDLDITNPVRVYLNRRRKHGLRESPPRTRYLSHEEETRLLQCSAAYLAPMIAFAIDTGLRLEEQLSLKWGQVSLQRRQVSVSPAVSKTGIGRTVPLLPRSTAILEALPRHIRSPFVFHKPLDGSRYGKLTRGLAGAAKRAGIEDLRWHDLRRTCGCRLLQDHRLKKHEVGDWLGQKSVVQTERAYAFLGVDSLHAAIDASLETVIGRAD